MNSIQPPIPNVTYSASQIVHEICTTLIHKHKGTPIVNTIRQYIDDTSCQGERSSTIFEYPALYVIRPEFLQDRTINEQYKTWILGQGTHVPHSTKYYNTYSDLILSPTQIITESNWNVGHNKAWIITTYNGEIVYKEYSPLEHYIKSNSSLEYITARHAFKGLFSNIYNKTLPQYTRETIDILVDCIEHAMISVSDAQKIPPKF